MGRAYKMVGCISVSTVLPKEDYEFWQDVLFRCVDEPADVMTGDEQISFPCHVDVWVHGEKTYFHYCAEMNLSGGQSQEEYAEEFRKAVGRLTQDVSIDFQAMLDLYYLERDADLSVEYNRQELAA